MDIQFSSDNSLNCSSDMAEEVRERIQGRLDTRFGSRLTRIEVHVRDVDGTNNRPDGIEAMIEARPANGKPIAVTARGGKPLQAVNSALGEMANRLDSVFGKADRHRP